MSIVLSILIFVSGGTGIGERTRTPRPPQPVTIDCPHTPVSEGP